MRDVQKKAFVKMLPNEEKDYAKTGGYDSLAFKRKKNKKPKKPKNSEGSLSVSRARPLRRLSARAS